MNIIPTSQYNRSKERSAVDRISRTVTRLLNNHPFFGSLALRLPISLDYCRSTIASDGVTLYVNPLWVDDADVSMLETAIARIVFACTLKHHTRRDDRIPEIWQLASQLVTHDYIQDCGFVLPEGVPTIADASVEEAYDMLLDESQEEQQSCEQSQQDSSDPGIDDDSPPDQSEDTADIDDDDSSDSDTDDSDPESGQSDADDDQNISDSDAGESDSDDNQEQSDSDAGQSDQDDGRSDSDSDTDNSDSGADESDANDGQDKSESPSAKPGDVSPDLTSGSGENPTDRSDSHDPHGTGEIMDAPHNSIAGSDFERATADHERDWDTATHQAAAFAKAQGNMPGNISELIDAALRVQMHWKDLLRKYATDEARSDYTWSYPNRRFIAENLYLPSIRSQDGIKSMAVIVDTSCSVRKAVLSEILGEIRHLAEETQAEEIHLLQVDHALQSAETLTCYDIPDSMEFPGRGGTSFVPGFEWLKDNHIRPTVCIYLTDMECDRYPDEEPNFPVIWINWDPPTIDEFVPPFGRIVEID